MVDDPDRRVLQEPGPAPVGEGVGAVVAASVEAELAAQRDLAAGFEEGREVLVP
ncbi:hypothetical protein [Streptomyces sp. NBC_01361]|uniref:hypothetical protein n=1 Tax=Streptomyces sp. NBC_01361 TaxID=2903838 RepID=UPI002E3581A1|nr:hypothetical protein [Streptomyces sp. NBC_01361]